MMDTAQFSDNYCLVHPTCHAICYMDTAQFSENYSLVHAKYHPLCYMFSLPCQKIRHVNMPYENDMQIRIRDGITWLWNSLLMHYWEDVTCTPFSE